MFEIVGFRYVDMTTKEGNEIKGHSCFILNHEEQEGLVGCEAFKLFFPADRFPDFTPSLHQSYELFFNQKGRLVGYAAIDDRPADQDAAEDGSSA